MKIIPFILLVTIASLVWFYQAPTAPLKSKGEQLRYQFTGESIGYSDIERLYSTDTSSQNLPFFERKALQTLKVYLSCDLLLTTLRHNQEGSLVSVQVSKPDLVLNNNTFAINTWLIEAELQLPVLVEVSESGRITSVKTNSDISSIADGMIKDLIGRLQFVKPATARSAWKVTEENRTGFFIASYQLLKRDSSGLLYDKKNLGYTKLATGIKGQRMIVDTKTTVRVAPDGTLKRMVSNESQAVIFHQDTISAAGGKVVLALTNRTIAASAELDSLLQLVHSAKYSESVTLSEGLSEEKINRLAYANTLGKENWESLSRQLLASASNHDKEQENPLTLKFRSLAYLNPGTCQLMADAMVSLSDTSYTFRVLLNALSSTESFAATDAMAFVIKRRAADENVLIAMLPIIATTQFPTRQALTEIRSLAHNTQATETSITTAQLTLGALAQRFRPLDSSLSKRIVQEVLQLMREEKDTLQQILTFGNTAAVEVMPRLLSYINSSEATIEIKVAAIKALQSIEHPKITSVLKALQKNKHPGISAAANQVLHLQEETAKARVEKQPV